MTLVTKGLIAATLLLAGGVGMTLGLPTAILVLAAGALCLVISLAWASLEKLGGSNNLSLEEALLLAAPTAAEEQKRAVLRTLKDLEYELSVGKISKEDFEVTSAHFRAEAKRLIAEADSSLSSRLELAEARVQEYLAGKEVPAPRKERRKKPKREEE